VKKTLWQPVKVMVPHGVTHNNTTSCAVITRRQMLRQQNQQVSMVEAVAATAALSRQILDQNGKGNGDAIIAPPADILGASTHNTGNTCESSTIVYDCPRTHDHHSLVFLEFIGKHQDVPPILRVIGEVAGGCTLLRVTGDEGGVNCAVAFIFRVCGEGDAETGGLCTVICIK
jgi:hypothetical protein